MGNSHAEPRWAAITGALVFLASAIAVAQITGDIFHPSMDEGIYLEGGERLLRGEVPYRDFFAFTGPLVFQLQAALQWLFGKNLPMLRLSVAGAFGLYCLGTYGLTREFAGWRTGLVTAFAMFGFSIFSLYRFTVGHRWLSAGLFSVGAWLVVSWAGSADRDKFGRRLILPGVLLSAAAWATPSFVLPLGLLLATLLISSSRRAAVGLVGGVLVVTIPEAVWLASSGALGCMLDNLLWASREYAAANAVPFGYYPGGAPWLRPDLTGARRVWTLMTAGRTILPVILGPLALTAALWAATKRRDLSWTLLTVAASGLLLTSWPRWDVNQLLYVTAPLFAIVATGISNLPRALSHPLAFGAVGASCFWMITLSSSMSAFATFPTRAGTLQHLPESAEAIETLEKLVPRREKVFVFPYMPVLGYVLDVANPTSYSFLQPGMMSAADEAKVLKELVSNPPRFVLLQYLPEEQVLNVWPHSDPSRLDFRSIRDFITTNYVEIEVVQALSFRITVLAHR